MSARIMVFLVLFVFCVAAFYGWVLNIVDLVHATHFTGLVAGRIVGIFIPLLGSVLGWFVR